MEENTTIPEKQHELSAQIKIGIMLKASRLKEACRLASPWLKRIQDAREERGSGSKAWEKLSQGICALDAKLHGINRDKKRSNKLTGWINTAAEIARERLRGAKFALVPLLMAALLGCSPENLPPDQTKQQINQSEVAKGIPDPKEVTNSTEVHEDKLEAEITSEDVGDYRLLREIRRGRTGWVENRLQRSDYTKEHKDNALIAAVEADDLHMVRVLADGISDVNAKSARALTLATEKKNTEIVRELLNAGADAQAGNNKALHTAVSNKDALMVALLVDRGANVLADEEKTLMAALANDDKRTMAVILSKYPKDRLIEIRDISNGTNPTLYEISSNVMKRHEDLHNKNNDAVNTASLSANTFPKSKAAEQSNQTSVPKPKTKRNITPIDVTM